MLALATQRRPHLANAPRPRPWAVADRPRDARVVLTEDGRTPRRQDVLRRLKRLLRKVGLQERSFHSLRHSFLTRLVRRGASVEAVRMLAGHSSMLVTERYVHATASDLHRAISLLSKAG